MHKTSVARVIASSAIVLAVLTGSALAGHAPAAPGKAGILLAAFGSSEAAAQKSFDHIEARVKARFPGIPVRWAFTSHMVRRKLEGQGRRPASPETALAGMLNDRFTHVAVQSLHTIGGMEYHELSRTVAAFKFMGGFQGIGLGRPLLDTQADMARAVAAVMAMIPGRRNPRDAIVLMGHGTRHPANAFYAALMFQLQLEDPNIFVGTVEGYPRIDLLKELLLKKKTARAWLMPLMSVAGDHARNDMAGDGRESWKSVLNRAGIQCTPVLRGTAEVDAFADIWVDHLQEVLTPMLHK
jgi:sirohydrochlorin cobaltochelatase